jgi:ferredoxin
VSARAASAAARGGEDGMKVKVDFDLCEANAVCMDVAPEVFRVDDDDNLHLLIRGEGDDVSGGLPQALHDKVREAVRLCPRQALSIVDE